MDIFNFNDMIVLLIIGLIILCIPIIALIVVFKFPNRLDDWQNRSRIYSSKMDNSYHHSQHPNAEQYLKVFRNEKNQIIATVLFPKPNLYLITSATPDRTIQSEPITYLMKTWKMNDQLFKPIFKAYVQAVVNSYRNHDQFSQ